MLADPLSRKRRHFPKMEGRRLSVCAIIFNGNPIRGDLIQTIKNAQPEGARFFEFLRSSDYLILVSLNSTCFFAIGSYFVFVILSVIVRLFFVVT